MKTEFDVSYSTASQRWQIYAFQKGLDFLSSASTLEFKEVKSDTAAPPLADLTNLEVQNLMDQLWKAGVRPTGESESDTSNMKLHLEDMRTIVSNSLGIDLRGGK